MTILDKAFKGISMPTFYKGGSILFTCSLIGTAINAKIQWASLNIGGKISMVSTFLFQCLFLALFLTLYFQIRKQTKVVENPEMDNFLQDLQKKDNKEKVKGGFDKNGKENNLKN